MAHEDFVHPIDDVDREIARGAAERTQVKSQVAHERIMEDLINHAMNPDTAVSEKLQIARELKDITATAERAKRQLASEGLSSDTTPRISLSIGTFAVSATGGETFIEGEATLVDTPELDEGWGL